MPVKEKKATLDTLVRDIAVSVDLVPDYTELFDLEQEQQAFALFVEEHVNEDSQAEMRTREADNARDEKAILAALPESVHPVYFGKASREGTERWIREEIAFRIGIEIGRRLYGGGR